MDTDVLIVGYGPAGAAAAIAAHDAGAEVLVLESHSQGGGNAVHSGGFLFDIPGDACVEHLEALCFDRTPRDVLVAYADGLHATAEWLAGVGASTERFDPPPVRLPAPFPSWPGLPGGHTIEYRVVSGGDGRRGEQLWARLHAAVEERRVPVHLGTAVADLALDGGMVTGVVTAAGETIRARRGVVLACGGFEGDPELADSYLPLATTAPVGHRGNTGAGLRMAQRVGASLWHMYGFFGWFAFRTPEYGSSFALDFFGASHVFVDADGHRFADETGYEVHDRLRALSTYLPRNGNRPRLPSWAIFDEATRLAGPLNGMLGTPNDYRWSPDNAAEVERGWIRAADGPARLAAAMGVDEAVLVATLEHYNASARAGVDLQFGRSADTLVPLDTSRLYAIPTWPGVAGTTGGPRHDAAARVLRPDGSPVPGLFAAGAVSMVWGHQIDHGGGLTDALVFGRIAGRAAAAPPVPPSESRSCRSRTGYPRFGVMGTTTPPDDGASRARGLHHIGYWVDDLDASMAQATALLGVGPFQVLEHVDLGDFRVDGEPAVLDHTAAFTAWGPVLLELNLVHRVEPAGLRTALRISSGAVSHVAWTTDDLAAENEHMAAAGCALISTSVGGAVANWFTGGSLFGHAVEVHQPPPGVQAFWRSLRD